MPPSPRTRRCASATSWWWARVRCRRCSSSPRSRREAISTASTTCAAAMVRAARCTSTASSVTAVSGSGCAPIWPPGRHACIGPPCRCRAAVPSTARSATRCGWLGRTYRTKEVHDIVTELDGIAAQTGCRRFYVTDLDFTIRRDFCIAVARATRDRGYSFVAMSRIEFADDAELLDELSASGFGEFCIGVESEDPSVLQTFNKKVDASAPDAAAARAGRARLLYALGHHLRSGRTGPACHPPHRRVVCPMRG